MFTVTKPALTLFVAGGMCAALAACSSSSSSSAPAASTTSASAAPSATASAATSAASSAPAAGAIPAADCTVIKQVSSSAITTLTPMQSESKTKAAADLATYLSQLAADEAKLTSAKGKSVLHAWIAAVQKAATQSQADATTTILGGLGDLGSACP
jgi:hypothetical protein